MRPVPRRLPGRHEGPLPPFCSGAPQHTGSLRRAGLGHQLSRPPPPPHRHGARGLSLPTPVPEGGVRRLPLVLRISCSRLVSGVALAAPRGIPRGSRSPQLRARWQQALDRWLPGGVAGRGCPLRRPRRLCPAPATPRHVSEPGSPRPAPRQPELAPRPSPRFNKLIP